MATVLALLIAVACGSQGGAAPAGGGAQGATATPKGSPLPSGNPYTDDYGY